MTTLPTDRELGARMQAARQRAGLTRAQVGACMRPRRSARWIYQAERAQVRMRALTLLQYARCVEAEVSEFLEWRGTSAGPGPLPGWDALGPRTRTALRHLIRELGRAAERDGDDDASADTPSQQ